MHDATSASRQRIANMIMYGMEGPSFDREA